jgi:hypothetical protein
MISFILIRSDGPYDFKRSTSFLASLSCLINILNVWLLGGVVMLAVSKRFFMDSSSYCTWTTSTISIGFSIPFPLSLFFFKIETFGRTCVPTASLRADDLVKGLLTCVLVVEGDEEKCNFLPFLVMALV